MSWESELDAVALEALDMFGREDGEALTFSYGGDDVPYYEENEVIKSELVLGGLANQSDLVIRCRKKAFSGAFPTKQSAVTIDGKKWKVKAAETSKGDPEVQLTLSAPNAK